MATRIPEEVIDQVRSSVNIADVIGQYVQLKKSGKNLFGVCPFHDEKTGSFSVNEEKQIFHCFSCGRGGNVFKFFMELENISFPEAVIKVAEDAHIDLPNEYQTKEYVSENSQNSLSGQLINLHEQAANLYHHILKNTKAGQQALEYLYHRGMNDATIDQFGIGFAPEQRLLYPFFDEKKVDYQLLRQTGLFAENQSGQLHDRFFGRVMFPIKNPNGKVIAFSGRLLSTENTDMPKYLNSPETEIFNKRRTLFNFDVARKSVRQSRRIILFEGFMDVIAATRAGVACGVASMGTSLTEEQINMMERVTSEIDVCYDGDDAGQNATNRALSIISEQSQKLKLNVVSMPAGIDPDEYIQEYGEDKLAEWLDNAKQTPVAFQMNYLKRNLNVDNEVDQLSYLHSILKVIANVPDSLEQDVYLNQLVSQFNLDKQTLQGQLQEILRQNQSQNTVEVRRDNVRREAQPVIQHDVEILDQTKRAERMLLRLMLHDHDVWYYVKGKENFYFAHESFQTLYLLAQSYFSTHDVYAANEFFDYIDDEKLQRLMIDLEEIEANDEVSMAAVDDYINVIVQKTPLKQLISEKKAQLKEATKFGNKDLEESLTIEVINLMRQQQEQLQSGGK